MSEIEFRNNPNGFRYEAVMDDELVSQIDYLLTDEVVTLTYTATPPQHRRRGLADDLTRFALEDIRTTGRKVLPLCPFATSFVADNPEYSDLVTHR